MVKRCMHLSGINAVMPGTICFNCSVWHYKRVCFIGNSVHCFFTVGSVKFLQLSFVIFAWEKLTEFVFVREECEKKL